VDRLTASWLGTSLAQDERTNMIINMHLENRLEDLARQREQAEVQRMAVTELLKVAAQDARAEGWSAQRIANTIGVAKRTVQLWTD